MIRRHITALRLSLIAVDGFTACAVFVLVSMVRFGSDWVETWSWAGLPAAVAMVSWAAAWITVVWLHGLYRLRTNWSLQADLANLVHALLLVGIVVFVVLFALNLPQVSRLFLIGLFGTQLVVALVSRVVLRAGFAWARSRDLITRYVLIAGTTPMADEFADLIEGHRELGLRVLGHLGPSGSTDLLMRRPVLGRLDEIEDVLHARVVDEVAICLPLEEWPLVEAITRICAEEGKVVRIPGADPSPRLAGANLEHYGGLTIQSLVYGPDRVLSLLAKRALDLAGAAVLLVLTSPLLLGIAIAIRLADGSPVIFRQPRVGLHGRVFRVLKFRTMVRDAEERQSELMDRNEVAGQAFKVTDDPRVMGIGRFLRRTSLDELPQLWNVLRGEMSLVGPRPPLPVEVAGYDVWHRRRLAMKPGITGLWQVSARRSPDFDQWVTFDLEYIDRWSLWLDMKILARTLPAMVEGR